MRVIELGKHGSTTMPCVNLRHDICCLPQLVLLTACIEVKDLELASITVELCLALPGILALLEIEGHAIRVADVDDGITLHLVGTLLSGIVGNGLLVHGREELHHLVGLLLAYLLDGYACIVEYLHNGIGGTLAHGLLLLGQLALLLSCIDRSLYLLSALQFLSCILTTFYLFQDLVDGVGLFAQILSAGQVETLAQRDYLSILIEDNGLGTLQRGCMTTLVGRVGQTDYHTST